MIKEPKTKQELFTLDEVLESLRSQVEISGNQTAFAEQLEIPYQNLSETLRGKRSPGPKILESLGVEKVIFYRKVY